MELIVVTQLVPGSEFVVGRQSMRALFFLWKKPDKIVGVGGMFLREYRLSTPSTDNVPSNKTAGILFPSSFVL